MKSKVAERIKANAPKDVKIFVRLYSDILFRVNQIMKEKGYTQKYLAGKLDKSPSEINKWLSGEHNFTLKSLAKLEAELGETFLYVSKLRAIPAFTESNIFVEKNTETKIVKMASGMNHTNEPSRWQIGKTITLETAKSNAG